MKRRKTLLIIIWGSFFLISLIQWINEEINDKKLLRSKKTFSFLVKTHYNDAVHGSAYGVIAYQVEDQKYQFKDIGDYRMMQIGDTILIEYAIDDHSVARVVDKYYMKKYKTQKK